MHDLTERDVGLKVLTGQGASLDTTTANGRLVFSLFAALAEFERELIVERTLAGLAAARARGRVGGSKREMTAFNIRAMMGTLQAKDMTVVDLAKKMGIHRATVYAYVRPDGTPTALGETVLQGKAKLGQAVPHGTAPAQLAASQPGPLGEAEAAAEAAD